MRVFEQSQLGAYCTTLSQTELVDDSALMAINGLDTFLSLGEIACIVAPYQYQGDVLDPSNTGEWLAMLHAEPSGPITCGA